MLLIVWDVALFLYLCIVCSPAAPFPTSADIQRPRLFEASAGQERISGLQR